MLSVGTNHANLLQNILFALFHWFHFFDPLADETAHNAQIRSELQCLCDEVPCVHCRSE